MGLGPSNIGKTGGDFASPSADSVQEIGKSLWNEMHSVFTVKKMERNPFLDYFYSVTHVLSESGILDFE